MTVSKCESFSIFPDGKYLSIIRLPISSKCLGIDTCLYINKIGNRRLKSVDSSGYLREVSLNKSEIINYKFRINWHTYKSETFPIDLSILFRPDGFQVGHLINNL